MRLLTPLALCFVAACSANAGRDSHSACDASACEPGGDASDAPVDSKQDAATVSADSGKGDPSADASQWVLGYYVGYQIDRYPLAEVDWSALTHIALAPLAVLESGSLDTRFSFFDDAAEGEAFARQLASAAHGHGVKALLMLGGAGLSDNVKPALADLDGFVATLLAKVDELGFDGIDLDVEAGNFDLDDFITLAQALRAARPELILTVPGATVQYGQAVDPRLVTLASALDRYNVQSYQGGSTGMFTGDDGAGMVFESWFYGALGGISAARPYSIDYALEQLASAGIPRAKLGMGIAFYAACYLTPDTTPAGGDDVSGPRMPTGAPSAWCWDCGIGGGDNRSSYNYFYAADGLLATSQPSEQERDAVAQEPYLSFAVPRAHELCGGSTRFVTYEDETSIKAKGAFSREHGYGGTIVWTIQQGWLPENAAGGRARNALMQALREGFLAP